jgi:diacylglycerol kinase (ATP)
VYAGRHEEMPEVEALRVRRIEIESPPMRIEADGEPLAATPVTIEVLPKALRVVVG